MQRDSLNLRKLMEVRVKDVMNPKPPMCKPELGLPVLLEKFRKQREDYVLVIDESKKLIGIVTETDVLYTLKRPSRDMFVGGLVAKEMEKATAGKVEDIMSREPLTISSNARLREGLDIMMTHRFRHLPVLENNEVVGVVTVRGIMMTSLKS